MSENEMPNQQEMSGENPVVSRVQEATESVWDKKKGIADEYVDIRKEMQSRLDLHGGGVYRRWVQDIDAVSKTIININKKNPIRYAAAGINSVVGRFVAAPGSFIVATLDIPYNIFTYPFRKLTPFVPRDLLKRSLLTAVDVTKMQLIGGQREIQAVREVGKAGKKLAETSVKIQKGAVEAVITAPEVVGTMAKRRIDAIVRKIKNPQEVYAEKKSK